MGIRGDMEAKYWAEMGHDKPREMASWFFDRLKDPNVWCRMQKENELTDAQTLSFLQCVAWLEAKMLTGSMP